MLKMLILLIKLGNILGILSHNAETFLKNDINNDIDIEGKS